MIETSKPLARTVLTRPLLTRREALALAVLLSLPVACNDRPIEMRWQDSGVLIVDGSHVRDVQRVDRGALIELDPAGSEKVRLATKGAIGKKIDIIVDGEIVASPAVRGEIDGGRILVTGDDPERMYHALADP